MALMGGQSLATVGWSATFGVAGREFFVSEALIKMTLTLGGIAAAYFVLTNANGEGYHAAADDVEVPFIRRVLALWWCRQRPPPEAGPVLEEPAFAQQPPRASPSIPRASPAAPPTRQPSRFTARLTTDRASGR